MSGFHALLEAAAIEAAATRRSSTPVCPGEALHLPVSQESTGPDSDQAVVQNDLYNLYYKAEDWENENDSWWIVQRLPWLHFNYKKYAKNSPLPKCFTHKGGIVIGLKSGFEEAALVLYLDEPGYGQYKPPSQQR